MSSRSIHWYPEAASDLDTIVDYLRERESHINAERVLDRIEQAVASLRGAPHRGRVVAELAAYGIDRYREVIVDTWRIVYRPEARAIYILTIVDTRRALDELLLERLIRAD